MMINRERITHVNDTINMKKPHILIVEDEMAIRNLLRYAFEIAGFSVSEAADVVAAKNCLAVERPDLIVLDWMLPKVSGIQFTKQLKKDPFTRDTPIIFLSAKATEEDKVHGLAAGADDYVIKPFSPRELVARVHAILRRGPLKEINESLVVGNLTMDLKSERVFLNNEPIKLAPIEFRLLRFFMQFPNRVHTRETLLTQVWERDVNIDDRTVDVHVRRLRKALKKQDQLIETVRGSGYRFNQ
jgi:two-component system phosphate regulon response regulator PhoB